jgi:ABC-type transport system substrate-binding protein
MDAYTPDRTRQLAQIATGDSMDCHGSCGLSLGKAEMLCSRRTDACRTDLSEHGYFYVKLNDHIPPFDDPDMREVARWALHVYKTAQVPFGIVGSHGQWMHFLFPEAKLTDAEAYKLAPWLDPDDRTLIPPDKWQLKAKDRLAELGYADGLELQYPWYGSTTPVFRDMKGIMSTDATAAGIRHEMIPGGFGQFTSEERAGKWNIADSSCASPLVDPTGGVAMGGLSWSATVGGRPWAWQGVAEADTQFTAAAKVTDIFKRGELLKDLERWYMEPTRSLFPMVWTLQFMPVPDCLRDFAFGPGLYGSMEQSHTWMRRDGLCFKNYESDLEAIEPTELNWVQTVMWNWQ